MPREKINQAAPFTPVPDNSVGLPIHGESWPEPEVHISWIHGTHDVAGHVQVAIDCDAEYLKHLVALAEDDRVDGTNMLVFSPVLDRVAVNKLIRTARRARDQAYGRDE